MHVVEGRRRQELAGVATDRAVQGHPEQRVAEETRPEVFGVLLVAALLRQRFLPRPGGAKVYFILGGGWVSTEVLFERLTLPYWVRISAFPKIISNSSF